MTGYGIIDDIFETHGNAGSLFELLRQREGLRDRCILAGPKGTDPVPFQGFH